MLIRSDKRIHTCLLSSLRGKAFSLSPLGMTVAIGFFFLMFIILLKKFLSILVFVECLSLADAFSTSIEIII